MASPGSVVYEENDRPRMGAFRKSFLKNVLINKPRLGATKRVTADIKDQDWIYGVCNEFDEEGVREVLVHKENVPDLEKKRGPDILAMNKLAVIRHVPRVCQQRQFREAHPIKLHISRRVGRSPSCKQPWEKDPDFIFGRPGEKSEEMWKVMQHGYSGEWVRMNMEHRHKFWKPTQLKKVRSVTELPWTQKTKEVYLLHCKSSSTPYPKAPFKMSRFLNVPKRIDNENPNYIAPTAAERAAKPLTHDVAADGHSNMPQEDGDDANDFDPRSFAENHYTCS